MQNKISQNKEFSNSWSPKVSPALPPSVKKLISINDLLHSDGRLLGALKTRAAERSVVLEHVRGALPRKLQEKVASAGLEHGRLTVGVAGAAWASRLRYATDALRVRVGTSLGQPIQSVRIKVVPPRT